MDSLLGTLAVLVIMAISSWLQKKAETQQRPGPPGSGQRPKPALLNQPPPPAGSGQPGPSRKSDWQEELRRLLEGDAPPVQPPPPMVVQETRHPVAPVVISLPRHSAPPKLAPALDEEEEGPLTSRLTDAAHAYRKAQQLHEETAGKLQQIADQARQHRPGKAAGRRAGRSPEIASAISLVRNPASVRQAFVASIIFSAPKGLEN